MREFLHVDGMADACVFLMERDDIQLGLFNIGTGQDVTIRQLAETVMDVVGFKGKIVFDGSKPDGTPRKLLCVSRMRELGWTAKTAVREGIARTYHDFLQGFGAEGALAGRKIQ
jgi:GDP-L-fucose synthase